ncbi:MAG: esterase family protein [Chitinophagaceae bacterium]|nr:esterase family protein [Chitinophagaceae bacterium]
MKNLFFLISIFFCISAYAGTVDTAITFSAGMQKQIKCVVIKPDNYKTQQSKFPVVYLLHGYSGSYNNWIKRVPELKAYADAYQMIIVCPDGGYSSWYFDSPIDTAFKYETYISQELVAFIDKKYKTLADKEHRAITGLSMGGHGGLFLGLRHADIFGAAGSISGGLDLYESRSKYDIIKRIGDTITHAQRWKEWSIINLIEKYSNTNSKLIIDCGINDFFIASNRLVHKKMNELKIKHDYTERPGEHNWDYWKNSIPYQLLFFKRFFDNNCREVKGAE